LQRLEAAVLYISEVLYSVTGCTVHCLHIEQLGRRHSSIDDFNVLNMPKPDPQQQKRGANSTPFYLPVDAMTTSTAATRISAAAFYITAYL
jgi:hypothetical protein